MAFVTVEYKSDALRRNTSFLAILPSDFSPNGAPYKCLYFLNGYGASSLEMATYLSFRKHCELKRIAVILPNGENTFYVDHPERASNFSAYIGEELVRVSRALLPLSDRREDTFIGGISMGGYGAVYNGIKYHDTFSKIVSMSGALDAADLYFNHPETNFQPEEFDAVFFSREHYENSDMNLPAAIARCDENRPELFFCCGEQDFLTGAPNREMARFLADKQIPHRFIWGNGDHDLEYWDRQMDAAFSFLAGIPEGSRAQLTLDVIL